MASNTIFFDNYTHAGNILTIFICIVLMILIQVAFIKDTENFNIFRRVPVLLIAASVASIFFHELLGQGDNSVRPLSYIAYLVYYGTLVVSLHMYMAYIKATMQGENKRLRWRSLTYILYIWLGVSLAIVAVTPFIGGGAGLFTALEAYVFAAIYTVDILFLVFMIFISRQHVYHSILVGVCAATGLSIILMYAQLFAGQSSFTSATYLFPAIAILYLMHSNPYDFALGTVDADAFTNMIKFNYNRNQELYFMSLYIHQYEISGGQMPREIQHKVRFYGERYFRNSQLFRISDGHLVLAFEPDKNPSYEDKIKGMLDSFYEEYENYKLDYKIIFTHSIEEISRKNEYIPFLQYMLERMDENEVLYVSEEDIADYNKHMYILEELEDIGKKKNMSDPRVLVFCQPVFNTQTGQYDTAEALMRLKLEKTGMVFPDQFIPLAEKYGLIHMLSLIILAKTCAQIKKMIAEGYNVKRISVNFSMIDVREPDFAENVRRIVSYSGIPFEKVAIEVTESQNEKDFMLVKDRISELRDSGIKFYLDDFGTGYSSFERIMELPFDIIKFDRSLTVASGADVKLETMVNYLAHMFSDMSYAVLYEGIENDDDEARCMRMCARYLQGYKYSKPIPIEQLTEYFVKTN